jgi:hypothetical protein
LIRRAETLVRHFQFRLGSNAAIHQLRRLDVTVHDRAHVFLVDLHRSSIVAQAAQDAVHVAEFTQELWCDRVAMAIVASTR